MSEQGGLSRKRAQTQIKLMRAAAEVFTERGIMASTVEQICERAGFTRGAFYSNFETKEALCEELMRSEKAFYEKAFARGVTAVAEHFKVHPDDRAKQGLDLVEVALHILLPYLFTPTPEDDEVGATASILYVELGMHAIREPAFRPAYLDYQGAWTGPFGYLLEHVFGLCGLRLVTSVEEAVVLLGAIYERATRDSFVLQTLEERADHLHRMLLLMARLLTEPIEPLSPDTEIPGWSQTAAS